MTAILEVLVVLLVARIFGRLAVACHQSSSIGEILAGVVLALALVSLPVELPWLSGLKGSEAVEVIGEVGIFLLLLLTGVEMEPKEIAQHSREAVLVAAGGMLLPLVLGCLLGWAVLPPSDLKQGQALIIGIGLSISAIPVAAKVFMELGLLHQAVGEIVIAAAVITKAEKRLLTMGCAPLPARKRPDFWAMLAITSSTAPRPLRPMPMASA